METQLQNDIEERLAGSRPDVEVILVEEAGRGALRVTIDHPDGVTLELCEQVTGDLADVRESYALEVSSPGNRRPLTRPGHFQRFVGRRARLKLEPAADRPGSLTGEITAAGDQQVTIGAPEGVVSIPYGQIKRANLIEE
ncbi:MAG: ribosome maturation factor RimP [Solirubrobacteraceae bacterium]|nr:ribosome maturation factor RimP [Solirubrobacteraceae bacterium]